jgi:UDP-N-acetylmuramoyl-L-alanyl-D-glutamate--2,6-diaminopimelate ligase
MLLVTELLKKVPEIAMISGWDDTSISGMTSDSRQVQHNWLFAAVDGTHSNGADYVPQALEKGASVVLCSHKARITLPEYVMRLEAHNVRLALAKLAAQYYAPMPAHITAITGTDGKTSTAEFIRQLWQAVGRTSASVGTLGVRCDQLERTITFPNTTPDPVILAEAFGAMAQTGVQHVAMEASSHGLHQYRLDGIVPRVAVFTTFGHDHGDYHPTFDDYFDAKARLFRELLPAHGGRAVLNADDVRIAGLAAECRARGQQVVLFGRNKHADFRIARAVACEGGQDVELYLDGMVWTGIIPLYGAFQVMNVVAALAALWGDVEDKHRLLGALTSLTGVPGRLDRICMLASGVSVFTDYAHTPDALANVLQSLRPHTTQHLWLVFGCGGDRDNAKRPLMGAVAHQLADRCIVTDDNPRSEDPALIRAAILAACPDALEIGNRVEAITHGMHQLKSGDVLLVAGKGHERTQTIGKIEHYHHDGETILEIAAKMQQ